MRRNTPCWVVILYFEMHGYYITQSNRGPLMLHQLPATAASDVYSDLVFTSPCEICIKDISAYIKVRDIGVIAHCYLLVIRHTATCCYGYFCCMQEHELDILIITVSNHLVNSTGQLFNTPSIYCYNCYYFLLLLTFIERTYPVH